MFAPKRLILALQAAHLAKWSFFPEIVQSFIILQKLK